MKGRANGHISISFISEKPILGLTDSNEPGEKVPHETQGSTRSFIKIGENS